MRTILLVASIGILVHVFADTFPAVKEWFATTFSNI